MFSSYVAGVLVLGIMTQVYYLRLDANLFLIIFGAGYVLRGEKVHVADGTIADWLIELG